MTPVPGDVPVEQYPIIIVGGGPTGLTLANLLARYGTRALLIERNATTVQEPRAVSIDDESLRTMQSAGVIDHVLPGIVAGYGSDYLSPRGRMFMRVEPSAQPYGYPRRNAFRQPRFEAGLRDALADSGTVATLFGHSVDRIEQDEAGVSLYLTGADGELRVVRGDYLVAADGGRSPIRTALGLSLDGETFEERWLIVDLENSPATGRNTMVFCNARRPCIALPGPDDTRRFEFKLMPGETPEAMLDDTQVRALIEAHGAHPDSIVCRKVVYTFHARLAAQWSKGRVFLAGDACHLTPPFAGQGMNSCIRDAHNLAWKLAGVVAGTLPTTILDSYEVERREHVREMIVLALRMGRIMGPASRARGLAIRGLFRLLGLWTPARDYFAQMKYKPSPRFAHGFVVPDGRSARTTAVGRLLPQPVVERGEGISVLLDQMLGDGFALIGFGDHAGALPGIARLPGFAALRPSMIGVCATAQGAPDPAVTIVADPTGSLIAAAGGTGHILLIRPDRYVAAAFTVADARTTGKALAVRMRVSPSAATSNGPESAVKSVAIPEIAESC